MAESARLRRRRNSREELPKSKARGGGPEEPPCAPGQGRRLGGATPNPRPGEAAGRSNPKCKEQWLRGRQEGLEELSHVEGQEGQE